MSNYEKLNELHRAMIGLDNLYSVYAKKYDVTKNELAILNLLLNEEGVTQKRIVEVTGITFTTLNSSIKNFIARGQVVMASNPLNRKEKFLYLSADGRKYAENIMNPLTEIEQETSKELSPSDIDAAIGCINRYKALLNERFKK